MQYKSVLGLYLCVYVGQLEGIVFRYQHGDLLLGLNPLLTGNPHFSC